MKKFFLLLGACSIACSSLFAGNYKTASNVGDAKWSLGISMEMADYYSPMLNKYRGFKGPLNFGPRITAWRNFNPSIALGLDLGTYSFTTKGGDATTAALNVNTQHVLYSGILAYKFNNDYILPVTFPVAPYLFVKLQGSYGEEAVTGKKIHGFSIPLGVGTNVKLTNDLALNLYGGYGFGINAQNNNHHTDHIFYGAGLMADLGKGSKEETPKVIEVPKPLDTDGDGVADAEDACPTTAGIAALNGCPDADGDGVADAQDECPTVKGLAQFKGCPDTDGDGIADAQDECPTVKGLAQFKGCPNPDTDGDGILDVNDACPTIAGLAALQGCPDTDGDGVADKNDKCPTTVGPASNNGCPEVKAEVKKRLEFIAKSILFETGSATVKPVSYKILDEVATILNQYKDYSVKIEGHTDDKGNAALNQTLSENRAKAALDYLVSKGVSASRLESAGLGSSKPKASNATDAGRKENRRVEFNLYLK